MKTGEKLPFGSLVEGVVTATGQQIFAIVCCDHQEGGWQHAAGIIRAVLDQQWLSDLNAGEEGRHHGIVQIGTGPVGREHGADWDAIRQAMEESSLPLHLYQLAKENYLVTPAQEEPERLWTPQKIIIPGVNNEVVRVINLTAS